MINSGSFVLAIKHKCHAKNQLAWHLAGRCVSSFETSQSYEGFPFNQAYEI